MFFSFNHFTPEGFSINDQNHLALDTVKAISIGWHLQELKGL